ncbi:UDP-4-amino-4,6-dideoxy-N-acetyl-beta-L-altrosamine N-acetyltransferase [Hymenobacter crusticola]|nr:UDP-4-amino-4,6-dideoxy-N-acetyl-beta-L-altrosamine N-acetyltransferase [Hymenobacter crusticola]
MTEADLEQVRLWRNSPAVSQFMYHSRLITPEDQKAWFEGLANDPTRHYWIIQHADHAVGVANLYNINQTFKSCYWAFYLGDGGGGSAGLGARVELAILEYVFEELSLNKLLCEVFVSNDKVIRLHEKFGFRREAYLREHVFKDNVFRDVIGLALLRREWKQIQGTLQQLFKR